AAGFQYVTFETRNTLRYSPSNGESLTIPICPVDPFAPCYAPTIQPGQTWAQEFVDMTRMDIDLSASYFFPDIVKDPVDASLGVGFKFIYASASRQYGNLNPVAANAAALNGALVGTAGLYTICTQNNCSDVGARDRVKEFSQIFGATFPMNVTTHL